MLTRIWASLVSLVGHNIMAYLIMLSSGFFWVGSYTYVNDVNMHYMQTILAKSIGTITCNYLGMKILKQNLKINN